MMHQAAMDKTVAATATIQWALQALIQGHTDLFSKDIREALRTLDDALATVEDKTVTSQFTGNEPTMLEYITDIPVEGYDTVLGYLAKNQSEALEIMGEPVWNTRQDDFWLLARCHAHGLEPLEVDAPEAMRVFGYPKAYAYPIDLLEKRLED